MEENALIDCVDAARLIPMKQGSLRMFLSRHKKEFPPRYRRGRHRKRVRVLTSTEVEQIRKIIFP